MSSRFKDLCTSRYLGAQPGPREEQTLPHWSCQRRISHPQPLSQMTLGLPAGWLVTTQKRHFRSFGTGLRCEAPARYENFPAFLAGAMEGTLAPSAQCPQHIAPSPVVDHCHPKILVQVGTSWAGRE